MSKQNVPGLTYVYRCYDADGRLIYVGMTAHLWRRLANHRLHAWWAPQVARVRAVTYPTRRRARHAERAAALREHPRWNVEAFRSAAARRNWTREQYADYVTARSYIHPWNPTDDRRMQTVQNEYAAKFDGEVLDLGGPPRTASSAHGSTETAARS